MTDFVSSESDARTVNNAVRHQYRVLTDGEKLSMTHIKDMGLGMIRAIDASVPEGRERDLAVINVEQAVMWAIKGLTA